MTTLRRSTAFISVLTLALIALPAVADVVWEQRVESDGFGTRHVGRMKSTTKLIVSDKMAREETSSEFTGKLLSKLSPDMASLNITRLDKGLIWTVNEKQGEYWEMTFTAMRQQREEAMANLRSMKTQRPDDAPPAGVGALAREQVRDQERLAIDQLHRLAGADASHARAPQNSSQTGVN